MCAGRVKDSQPPPQKEASLPTVIAYAFDADVHCLSCALERFTFEELSEGTAVDSEGNPPTAIFDIDEVAAPDQGCGTCGEGLET